MVRDNHLGLIELPDAFNQGLAPRWIEIIRWLVKGKDFGIHGQHGCQGYPLLLSFAQVVSGSPLKSLESNHFKGSLHPMFDCFVV
jgi:hypothetical protein